MAVLDDINDPLKGRQVGATVTNPLGSATPALSGALGGMPGAAGAPGGAGGVPAVTGQLPANITAFNPNKIPGGFTPPPGWNGGQLADWQNALLGTSQYQSWAQDASHRADVATAQRRAALQALAVRYGGLPKGFQDVYGDITPDIAAAASNNPLSENARIEKAYTDSREQNLRQLAARGALQSGDLGYSLGQLDYGHSSDLYDAGNAFTGEAQGDVNSYIQALTGLNQEQIAAVQAAANFLIGGGYSPVGGPVTPIGPQAPSVTPTTPTTTQPPSTTPPIPSPTSNPMAPGNVPP